MKKIFTLLFLVAISVGLFAQKQVSGVVVYDNGEPVIGASVQAKGTTQGTISDYDGQFEMEVPETVKTLVISYVGMASGRKKHPRDDEGEYGSAPRHRGYRLR